MTRVGVEAGAPVRGSKVKRYHVRKIILKNKKYTEQRNKVTVLACFDFFVSGHRTRGWWVGRGQVPAAVAAPAVAAVAAQHSDLVLVQLDAHADLREEWIGARHSHACAMRRCLEVLPSQTLFQLAIRSGTREEFTELHESGRLMPSIDALQQALTPLQGKPIYLTVDLDWFDPSVLPGTGTPEPGGYHWSDFASLIAMLQEHHLVAADVVELAPQLDTSGISSVLAAKVTRSLLLLLGGD